MNWPYVAVALLISTAAIVYIAWETTEPVYRSWIRGLPIRGGWSWPIVIAWDVFYFLVLLALFWKIYCDANTEMGETELSRPSLFGIRRIRWSEVVGVKQVGFGYHVFSRNNKIVLTPFAYRSPESVVSMLQSRIVGDQRGSHVS
jgi:hypothetical protein